MLSLGQAPLSLAVVLDTSVLFPFYLRDTLLSLAAHDVFGPVLSHCILAELEEALVRRRGLPQQRASKLLETITSIFDDCIYDKDELQDSWRQASQCVSDSGDVHIVAAALAADADAIATANHRHFREQKLDEFAIEVWAPSTLLEWAWNGEQRDSAEAAFVRQCSRYENPRLGLKEVAAKVDDDLERAGDRRVMKKLVGKLV